METHKQAAHVNTVKQGASKKKMFAVIGLIIFLAAIVYTAWYLKTSSTVYTDDASVDADKVTVSSKYSGRIASLQTKEGDNVLAGQVLVKLDTSDLLAQKEQAKAALVFAEENSKLAKVNLDRAVEDFSRIEAQYNSKIVSKEQYDHTEKALQAAKVQDSIAKSQIKTSSAQLGIIETQLNNAEIKASMDGVVAKRWVLPGDVVSAGQAILTVYDLKNIWVDANFEETKYSKISLGESSEITVDAYSGMKIFGKVTQLGSNTASQFSLIPANNASGNFTKITQRIPIKITPDTGEQNKYLGKLLPGMSVEVLIKMR